MANCGEVYLSNYAREKFGKPTQAKTTDNTDFNKSMPLFDYSSSQFNTSNAVERGTALSTSYYVTN